MSKAEQKRPFLPHLRNKPRTVTFCNIQRWGNQTLHGAKTEPRALSAGGVVHLTTHSDVDRAKQVRAAVQLLGTEVIEHEIWDARTTFRRPYQDHDSSFDRAESRGSGQLQAPTSSLFRVLTEPLHEPGRDTDHEQHAHHERGDEPIDHCCYHTTTVARTASKRKRPRLPGGRRGRDLRLLGLPARRGAARRGER